MLVGRISPAAITLAADVVNSGYKHREDVFRRFLPVQHRRRSVAQVRVRRQISAGNQFLICPPRVRIIHDIYGCFIDSLDRALRLQFYIARLIFDLQIFGRTVIPARQPRIVRHARLTEHGHAKHHLGCACFWRQMAALANPDIRVNLDKLFEHLIVLVVNFLLVLLQT